jgi:PAS domain S-box-containing protein
LVALLALLPGLLFALAWAHEERRGALAHAETKLRRTLDQIARVNGAIFQQVAPMLEALARLPEIRTLDPSRCAASLRAVRDVSSRFTGLVLADATGRVVCSGRPLSGITFRGDRPDFRRVVQTQRFAVGTYAIGRESHEPIIHFAQPVFDEETRLIGVLTATLSLHWLNDYLAQAALPPNHVFLLTDASGTVLARHPQDISDLGKTMPGNHPAGIELGGAGDIVRLFATAPLGDSPDTGITLWLGIDKKDVTRDADTTFDQTLGLGVAVATGVALLIWLTSYVLLGRPTRRLALAAQQIAVGDFTRDPVRGREVGELGELGAALDDMAAKLAVREAALVESEVRFRSTFENAAVGISHLTREGCWLRVNDRQCEITGYSREELLARRAQDITHPDDVAEGDRAAERLWAGEIATYARRKRLIRKGGEIIWVAITVSLARKADGSPDYSITIIEDITKAKEAEMAIQAALVASEHLRLALAAGQMGTWEIDHVRQVRDHSRETRAIFGWHPDEPLPWHDLLSQVLAEDRPALEAAQERLQTHDDAAVDYRIRRTDGAIRWLSVRGRVVERHADGNRARTVGVVTDVTERKAAEGHVRLLMREINHRAKNLLTVVQAVARQTAGEVAPEVFAERFGQRIAGLAASHDLLARNEWKGVEVADLVRSQLAHFGNLVGTRVRLEGPSLRLRASAAQAVGMALHELATNAVKYGALSNLAGSVAITWDTITDAGSSCFEMKWSEEGGPPPDPNPKFGFGHMVLVQMFEHALDATVRLDCGRAGVVWKFRAPTERVIGGDDAGSETIDADSGVP